jgi:succinoglycan biosynthesis protein ExoO
MKVSILMAAYNAAECIPRALASVQAQTHDDWEAIVVDDASTDETVSVVAALARREPRIRLLRRERNGGPSAARNTALDAATGEWVAVLDADDAWRPERLERLLAAAARTGAELVADNQIFFDGELQQEVGVALPLAADIDPLTVEILFTNEREDSPMGLGLMKPLISRSAVLERGIRYDETLRYTEDLHFYAQLLIAGVRAVLLAEAYYLYTNPIGFLSGERSRHSRTKTSTESRLRIADDLIGRFAARLSPQAKTEILAFRDRATQRIAIQKITTLRLSRDYARLTLFLARHPRTAWRYLASSRTFHRFVSPGGVRGKARQFGVPAMRGPESS